MVFQTEDDDDRLLRAALDEQAEFLIAERGRGADTTVVEERIKQLAKRMNHGFSDT